MIIWLNCLNNDRTYTKKNYLLDAAKRLGLITGFNEMIQFQDYYEYKENETPDFILNIEPFNKFVKGKIWTGIWEIDNVLDRREMSESDWYASDDVFIANSALPDRMSPHKHLCQLLFQACDPVIHRRKPVINQEFDFVFSGSIGSDFYKQREQYLDILKSKFTFADFGKNHRPSQYVDFLNKARVQFVQSGTNQTAPNGYIAQRFFECLAIGPVLTNYHPDLEFLGLVEGVDYFSFKDETEMVQKMSLLINDKDLQLTMAQSGRNKALLLHTYEHRLITIINKIKEHLATR